MTFRTLIIVALGIVCQFVQADDDGTIVLREAVVIPSVGVSGRSPVPRDAIQARIAQGKWSPPKAGDQITLADGATRSWTALSADKDGNFQSRAVVGGYVSIQVPSASDQIMLLRAAGHSMVYAGLEPRAGDPYQHGYVVTPIRLRAGDNELLFQGGRGSLRAKLVKPKAAAQFDLGDATTPDLLVEQAVETWMSIVVLNSTTERMEQLEIRSTLPGGTEQSTAVPPLLPLSTRKVAVRLQSPAAPAEGNCDVKLLLVRKQGDRAETLDSTQLGLRIRQADQTHKRTFISQIDGSVQYYAIVPAQGLPHEAGKTPTEKDPPRAGLVLTLHGASVEALGQAAAYSAKPDLYIVAPTNRRPYGFDWEDWGRLDALEVLDLAQKQWNTDPARTYLTGHSMGGHGAWQVGVHYPDRFAAVGPSAGWVSMFSYAGSRKPTQPGKLDELLARAANPSDTLALSRNYRQQGIYVLHGDQDDNVPVDQARTMRQELAGFHPDFVYHEEPGMGHWWGKAGVSGSACVDWPAMFDFFRQRTIVPANAVDQFEFATASPAVSASCRWVTVEDQVQRLKTSTLNVRCERDQRRFTVQTQNVGRLSIDVSHLPPDKTMTVVLDGQKLDALSWPGEAAANRLYFSLQDNQWTAIERPSPMVKRPQRFGPFKEVFRNRVLLVYGTRGSPEENAWLLAKARYDAEVFWYRGNGSFDVISDEQFNAEPASATAGYPGRNVVLYGNADNNSAWNPLFAESPVQVNRRRVRLDDREFENDRLACLFVRPRPGDDTALVGAVAGTGLAGLRLTERLPYFLSGVAYPDCIVLGPETLAQGAAGVLGAGIFGSDWSITSGEFAWRD